MYYLMMLNKINLQSCIYTDVSVLIYAFYIYFFMFMDDVTEYLETFTDRAKKQAGEQQANGLPRLVSQFWQVKSTP